ncbi:MAG TPA: hypothetical protein VEG33_05490 [Streptosporangiaceae bacterium]|nr:hypothetical protein [Streptosporangiaceae bacterium]
MTRVPVAWGRLVSREVPTRAVRPAALALGLLATAAPVRAQLAAQGTGLVAVAEHRVDAGRGVEQASGMVIGGEGTLFIGARTEIFVHAAGGKLTATSDNADDHDLAELELKTAVVPVPWLALHVAVSTRTYSTPLVRERWTALRFGGEARLAFVGAGVTGLLRLEVLPSVSVSGLEDPSRAFAAGAGLEWRAGVVTLGLRYDLERYDFPTVASVNRREQLSMLTAHAGLRLGGR